MAGRGGSDTGGLLAGTASACAAPQAAQARVPGALSSLDEAVVSAGVEDSKRELSADAAEQQSTVAWCSASASGSETGKSAGREHPEHRATADTRVAVLAPDGMPAQALGPSTVILDAVSRAEPGASVAEIAAGQRPTELLGPVEAAGCRLVAAPGSGLSTPAGGRVWCVFRKVTRPDEPIRSFSLDGPASGLTGAGACELRAADVAEVRRHARLEATGLGASTNCTFSLPGRDNGPAGQPSLDIQMDVLADTVYDTCPSRLVLGTSHAMHVYTFRGEQVESLQKEMRSAGRADDVARSAKSGAPEGRRSVFPPGSPSVRPSGTGGGANVDSTGSVVAKINQAAGSKKRPALDMALFLGLDGRAAALQLSVRVRKWLQEWRHGASAAHLPKPTYTLGTSQLGSRPWNWKFFQAPDGTVGRRIASIDDEASPLALLRAGKLPSVRGSSHSSGDEASAFYQRLKADAEFRQLVAARADIPTTTSEVSGGVQSGTLPLAQTAQRLGLMPQWLPWSPLQESARKFFRLGTRRVDSQSCLFPLASQGVQDYAADASPALDWQSDICALRAAVDAKFAALQAPAPAYSMQWQFGSTHSAVSGLRAYSLSPLGTLEVYSLPASRLAAGTDVPSRPCLLAVHRVATGVRTAVTKICPLVGQHTGVQGQRRFGDGLADLTVLDAAKRHVDKATSSLHRRKSSDVQGELRAENTSYEDAFTRQTLADFVVPPQALGGVLLYHNGEGSESVGRLLATMDVARLKLPRADRDVMVSRHAASFRQSRSLLEGLDMNDTLEVLQALQSGDVDEAARRRGIALGEDAAENSDAPPSQENSLHVVNQGTSTAQGSSDAGWSREHHILTSDSPASVRSRLLILSAQTDVDLASGMFRHASHRQARASGSSAKRRQSPSRRGAIGTVSYSNALQALVQGLSVVDSCLAALPRQSVLESIAYVRAGVDSGTFLSETHHAMLTKCLSGLIYLQRLCRLQKSMLMHLGECMGRLTRPPTDVAEEALAHARRHGEEQQARHQAHQPSATEQVGAEEDARSAAPSLGGSSAASGGPVQHLGGRAALRGRLGAARSTPAGRSASPRTSLGASATSGDGGSKVSRRRMDLLLEGASSTVSGSARGSGDRVTGQERLLLLASVVSAGARSIFEAQRSLEYCWLGPSASEGKVDVDKAVQWVALVAIASGAAAKNTLTNPTGDPRSFTPVILATKLVHLSLRVHPLAVCQLVLSSPSLDTWEPVAMSVALRAVISLWGGLVDPAAASHGRRPRVLASAEHSIVDGDDDDGQDDIAADPSTSHTHVSSQGESEEITSVRRGSAGGRGNDSSGMFSPAVARTACKLQQLPAGLLGLTAAAVLATIEQSSRDSPRKATPARLLQDCEALCAALRSSEEGCTAVALAAATIPSLADFLSIRTRTKAAWQPSMPKGVRYSQSSAPLYPQPPVVTALKSRHAGPGPSTRLVLRAVFAESVWSRGGGSYRVDQSLGLGSPQWLQNYISDGGASTGVRPLQVSNESLAADRARLADALLLGSKCRASIVTNKNQAKEFCLGHSKQMPVSYSWDDSGSVRTVYSALKRSWARGIHARAGGAPLRMDVLGKQVGAVAQLRRREGDFGSSEQAGEGQSSLSSSHGELRSQPRHDASETARLRSSSGDADVGAVAEPRGDDASANEAVTRDGGDDPLVQELLSESGSDSESDTGEHLRQSLGGARGDEELPSVFKQAVRQGWDAASDSDDEPVLGWEDAEEVLVDLGPYLGGDSSAEELVPRGAEGLGDLASRSATLAAKPDAIPQLESMGTPIRRGSGLARGDSPGMPAAPASGAGIDAPTSSVRWMQGQASKTPRSSRPTATPGTAASARSRSTRLEADTAVDDLEGYMRGNGAPASGVALRGLLQEARGSSGPLPPYLPAYPWDLERIVGEELRMASDRRLRVQTRPGAAHQSQQAFRGRASGRVQTGEDMDEVESDDREAGKGSNDWQHSASMPTAGGDSSHRGAGTGQADAARSSSGKDSLPYRQGTPNLGPVESKSSTQLPQGMAGLLTVEEAVRVQLGTPDRVDHISRPGKDGQHSTPRCSSRRVQRVRAMAEASMEADLVHPSAASLSPAEFRHALSEATDAHEVCALSNLMGFFSQEHIAPSGALKDGVGNEAKPCEREKGQLAARLSVLLVSLTGYCFAAGGALGGGVLSAATGTESSRRGPEAHHRNGAAALLIGTRIVDLVAAATRDELLKALGGAAQKPSTGESVAAFVAQKQDTTPSNVKGGKVDAAVAVDPARGGGAAAGILQPPAGSSDRDRPPIKETEAAFASNGSHIGSRVPLAVQIAQRAAAALGSTRPGWALRLAARCDAPDSGLHPVVLRRFSEQSDLDASSRPQEDGAAADHRPLGSSSSKEAEDGSVVLEDQTGVPRRPQVGVAAVVDLLQTIVWCMPTCAARPLAEYISRRRGALGLRSQPLAKRALEAVTLVREGRGWDAVFLLLGGLRGLRSPSAALEVAFGLEPRVDCWRGVIAVLLLHLEREGQDDAADARAALLLARNELSLRLPASDFRLLVPAAVGSSGGPVSAVHRAGGGQSSQGTGRAGDPAQQEQDPGLLFRQGVSMARQRAAARAGVLALSGLERDLASRHATMWKSMEAAARDTAADETAGPASTEASAWPSADERAVEARHRAVAALGAAGTLAGAASQQAVDGSSHGDDVVTWDVSPVEVLLPEEGHSRSDLTTAVSLAVSS